MPLLHGIKAKIMAALTSKRGHNLLLFAVFLVLSFILWLVLAISEDAIVDMQVGVRIDNVPDSVTLLANPPASIAVSARLHGSQRIKIGLSDRQTISIMSCDTSARQAANAVRSIAATLSNSHFPTSKTLSAPQSPAPKSSPSTPTQSQSQPPPRPACRTPW